VEYDLTLVE